MRTLSLGKTGAEVSAVCLGAMFFGSKVDEATSFSLLDRYTEQGGSFLDTSNNYAHWIEGCEGSESETLLGKWFARKGNRSKIFLSTKVGFDRKGVGAGLRAGQIVQWCDNSLKTMGTDYIDLYYSHVDDRDAPLEETMEAFGRLVKAGKVRYLGASNYRAWRLERARAICEQHNLPSYCCVQQCHTYLYPKPGASRAPQVAANDDLFDYCKSTGMTVLAYSPLMSGAYEHPERLQPQQFVVGERLNTIQAFAKEKGVSCSQLVLAWLVHSNVIPVMAASQLQQIDDNVKALEIKLSSEEMRYLDQA